MKRIIISNFGAIKSIDLPLDDNLNIVIGAQASGKSTLAKTIYFCRKTRDYCLDYITSKDSFTKTHPNEYYTYLLKFIRKQFMGCFGTTKHMRPFKIQYFFVDSIKVKKFITLSLDQKGFVRIDFSSNLMDEIKKLILEGANLFSANTSISDGALLSNLLNDLKTRQVVKQHFSGAVNNVFSDDEEIIYIPAGRSVLATLSDQLHDLDITTMDLPLQEFIEIIQTTKQKFGSRIPEIISNYTKTIDGQIKNADVDTAYSIIRRILKADYVNESDGEKLYYSEHEYVKLMYASSGQQEVLWILLLMFIKILEQKKVFLVLEEPEAHLFPTAQMEIIKFISLLINSTESSVFITTHSPYILTSLNLLLYSGKVENDHKNRSYSAIIDRILRINPNKIQAYMISNQEGFVFESIKDCSEKLIDATRIDAISNIINEETEKLIDMEIKYDM